MNNFDIGLFDLKSKKDIIYLIYNNDYVAHDLSTYFILLFNMEK
jgi:hypothetical protein